MEKQGIARNAALAVVLSLAATFGQSQLSFTGAGADFGPGSGPGSPSTSTTSTSPTVATPPVWNAPQNSVFYDHSLIMTQYGFGTLGSVVAGAMGFYLGNAFAGAAFTNPHEGYLSFTGIRYHDWTGPFYGGASGVLLGSVITVFFFGEMDEEPGSIWLTTLGGIATTAAGFYLAKVSGVQDQRSLLPFVPLLIFPATGAVVGWQVSRWFNDRERRKITEPGTALLLPPRLEIAPRSNGQMALRLDAVNLSF